MFEEFHFIEVHFFGMWKRTAEENSAFEVPEIPHDTVRGDWEGNFI